MKTLRKILFAMVLFLGATFQMQGKSTVWFFIDFSFYPSTYSFTVNGEAAFSLTPEVRKVWDNTKYGGEVINIYKMCARKVIFENPGSYVVGTGYVFNGTDFNTEVNLNVEDGQTYYVLINSNMKRSLYCEMVDEKQGLKLLKKAQDTKKYTINEDFVYTGK